MKKIPTKICVILGTRPEAIKLSPLVLAARFTAGVEVTVCNTGQHREMTAQVLDLFGITSDIDLDVMRESQSLTDITTSILVRLQSHFEHLRPDWVVVQGDTTTTFAGALAAFYQKIRVAHVEAGLRTGDIYSPWPEEMNRRLVSEIACLHFPPTEFARANLLREGFSMSNVQVTGNTGIDALKLLVARLSVDHDLAAQAQGSLSAAGIPRGEKPVVLITGHRRESFGEGFESICSAISTLAHRFPGHDFVYPVHPNPRVRETVFARLGDGVRSNVFLVPPLDYLPFVQLMSRADLILTDSGGVQEEAPSLGKRVIVLRDVTERSEGLGTGLIRLAGTDSTKIVDAATEALSGAWPIPPSAADVYGDGLASQRIVDALRGAV